MSSFLRSSAPASSWIWFIFYLPTSNQYEPHLGGQSYLPTPTPAQVSRARKLPTYHPPTMDTCQRSTWQQSVQLAGVRTQPWTRCSWTAPAISGCAVGWSRAPARSSPGSETARRSGRATERSARGPHGRHEPPLRMSTDVPHVEATFRRANNIQHVPTFRPPENNMWNHI